MSRVEVVGGDLLDLYRKVRREFPLAMYSPYPEQEGFHSSEAGVVVASGGNQSGKSTALLAQSAANSMGFRIWLPPEHPNFRVKRVDGTGRALPVPNTGQFACVDYANAWKNSLLPKFEELMPRAYYTLVKNAQGIVTEVKWSWASRWLVKSYDQEWLKYESGTIDWAGFDEPPPRKIFISTLRGLMKSAGPVHVGATPHSEAWMLAQVHAREDGRAIAIFRLPTRGNKALSKVGVDRFESFLTGAEVAMRLEGDVSLQSGKCVPDFFDKSPWVCEPFEIPSEWYRVMILDPHENKPDAVVWWALSPDGKESVFYDEMMDGRTRGAFEKVADAIFSQERSTGGAPARRLVDPRAAQKTVRDRGQTYLQAFGAAGMRLEPAPGLTMLKGFKAVSGWFRATEEKPVPFCRVFSSCPRLVHQLAYTCWVVDPNDYENRPRIQGADDMIACARYLATWGPNVSKLKTFGPQGEAGWIERPEDEKPVNLAMVESGAWTGYGSDGTNSDDWESPRRKTGFPVASWKR